MKIDTDNTRQLNKTDRPIESMEEDIFKIDKYILGLSNFIRNCVTPMTIAIQGDWGSGKTSFMNMIREEISKELKTVWINTWQFSQFNLSDSLINLFLTALTDSLGNETQRQKKMKESLKKVAQIGYAVGLKGMSQLIRVDIEGVAKDIENAIRSTEESEDAVKIIVELKKHFQELIDETLQKNNCSKLVIFIDDLDRLMPSKAVEILEALKLFLDCEHCVFILAIDYKVVSQGIRQKYGDAIEEDKERNFFDKIIQVPFKVPVAHYSIKSYIERNLEELSCGTEHSAVYEKLISRSVGFNPRGIKRVFNAFSLLKEIYTEANLDSDYKQLLLFAALCLQLSYEEIYNYIIRNENNDVDILFFEPFALPDKEENSRAVEIIEEIGVADQKEAVLDFMEAFCEALSSNINNDKQENSVGILLDILEITETTSKLNIKTGKGKRYRNVYDAQYSWHSIDEPIEKNKSEPGWNGCKIDSYEFFGEQYKVSTLSEVVLNILAILYEKDKTRFEEIRKNADHYKLYGLFYGSRQKGALVSPQDVPNTEIKIEGKNSYNQKIQFLRDMLDAMGYSRDALKLYVKLARRAQE